MRPAAIPRPACPPPQVFKLKFLLPYLDRLLRLADNKTLREELTAFPLAVRCAVWGAEWGAVCPLAMCERVRAPSLAAPRLGLLGGCAAHALSLCSPPLPHRVTSLREDGSGLTSCPR